MPPKTPAPQDNTRDYVVAIVKALGKLEESIKEAKKDPLDDVVAATERIAQVLPKLVELSEKELKDGEPGKNGVSITEAEIQGRELVLTFSDGAVVNVGQVVGKNGEDAKFNEAALTKRILAQVPKVDREGIIKEALTRVPKPTEPPSFEEIVSRLKKGKAVSWDDIKDRPDIIDLIKKYTRHLERPQVIVGASGGSSGGAAAFTDLTDAPNTYAGSEQRFVKVNAEGTGLEFVAGSGAAVAWGDLTGAIADQADLQAALDAKAAALTADQNYVTDAQLVVIGNTSGTNTGNVTVTDSAEIDFTLTGQNITASLKTSSIDETKLDASVNASLDLADSAVQPGDLAAVATSGNYNDLSNKPSIPAAYTDANARAAISLTTTGSAGAATYNPSTGVLNVPQYSGGTGGAVAFADLTGVPSDNAALDSALLDKYDASNPSEYISNLSGFTTADLSESGNLYFTDPRARAAVGNILVDSSDIDFTYNSGTPSITASLKASSPLLKKSVAILASDPLGDAITTGDGKVCFRVPPELNGMNLVAVGAQVSTVSSSGVPTFQVRRSRRTNATTRTDADMLSTALTIDASEFDSVDAATPAVINTSNDDVQTGDMIYIDFDVAGTGTKGVSIDLSFQTP